MDPNILKLLEVDEDEATHSRADVEAFAAGLITSCIGPGNIPKAPPNKPLVGQQKPPEAPDLLSHSSSKKRKVSGDFVNESFQQLNDVTAVSGIDLREEEDHLFSGLKKGSLVSEVSRQVVVGEEESVVLHKIPLKKKLAEKMAKCGLKKMSNDVEQCLSLCVEERMRGLISNLIRLSKQHIDIEKPMHRTVITSNVKQQVMTINRQAHEEWERKQAEKENTKEPESATGVDGDKKDESSARSAKDYKKEYDKTATAAANIAARAATGVADMTSRWQLMIKAKEQWGRVGTSNGPQPGKDALKRFKPSTRNTRNQYQSETLDTPAMIRKVGRNQVMVPQLTQRITSKDVIAVLEREPQMLKSTLIYTLCNKVLPDANGE